MPIASTHRVMRHPGLSARPVDMNLSSQKGRALSRKANGQYLFPSHHPLLIIYSYANTDYVVARSTSHNLETKKIASYDIACQWSVNLRKRLEDFPLQNAERLDDQIVAYVVPKFHLAAHKQSCRIEFSLNYEPGAGRSDMEGPERTWFGLQGGGSTRDQGPGYWSDAMDDKFGHWNWSKLIRLGRFFYFSFPPTTTSSARSGTLLARKYANALTQSTTHVDEFDALCTDIPEGILNSWSARILAWEVDRDQPNPYFNLSSGTFECVVYRRPS